MAKSPYGSAEDYVKLTDYIQKIYDECHLDPPWALLMSQVKNICKQYKLKYKDVLAVIKYMTQIEDISIAERDTLGLVPYYVERTEKYIKKYKEIQKEVKEFERSENIIKMPKNKQFTSKKRKNENFD